MNIRLFNRKYLLRSFSEPVEIRGYVGYVHSDRYVSIHVHPSGGDQVSDRDGAGEMVTRRLEGHGEVEIKISNRETGTKADMLYFNGHWYECVSCELWFHTILKHYNYRFALVQDMSEGAVNDLEPPIIEGSQGL